MYDFGTFSYNDISSTYDEAAKCFYELENISRATRGSWGFSGISTVKLAYPYDFGVDDTTTHGEYVRDSVMIRIADDDIDATSHEYGHHIHYEKGVSQGGGFTYGGCVNSDTELRAYKEGWAESIKDWRYGVNMEDSACGTVSTMKMRQNRAAIYDLRDNADDGEECQLTWANLIAGLGDSEDIIEYMDDLQTLYSGSSDDIDDVIDVNYLSGGFLLASAGLENSPALPQAAEQTELMANSPNPPLR